MGSVAQASTVPPNPRRFVGPELKNPSGEPKGDIMQHNAYPLSIMPEYCHLRVPLWLSSIRARPSEIRRAGSRSGSRLPVALYYAILILALALTLIAILILIVLLSGSWHRPGTLGLPPPRGGFISVTSRSSGTSAGLSRRPILDCVGGARSPTCRMA